MSGEVLSYDCSAINGKVKYMLHRDRIKNMVFNHLQLDLDNYVVFLFHDDDENLQEHKWQRDKNRYYEDGSIVRAFVREFNINKYLK